MKKTVNKPLTKEERKKKTIVDYNKKALKKKPKSITNREFEYIKQNALKIERSKWAEFHAKLVGFDLYNKRGFRVCKFEAFSTGYKAEDILSGKTSLKAVNRETDFIKKLEGYELYNKAGELVSKSDAFAMGLKFDDIINEETVLTVKKCING